MKEQYTASMHSVPRGYSLVSDVGRYWSSCGYCCPEQQPDGPRTSCSHGMHAYRLTVYDYQELLDQGWRRSGKFLYRPENDVTCCRLYTIRLDTTRFVPSKQQCRLMRRWQRFLDGEVVESQPGSSPLQPCKLPPRLSNQRQQLRHQQQQQEQQEQQQQQRPPQQLPSLLNHAQAVLQQAAILLVSAGQLPQQELPPLRVLALSPQQASKLPSCAVFTSPCAMVLAAAARKALPAVTANSGCGNTSRGCAATSGALASNLAAVVAPEALAQTLAATFNDIAAAAQPPLPLVATAVAGHINFSHLMGMTSKQQEEQEQQLQQQQQNRAECVAECPMMLQPQQQQHAAQQQQTQQHARLQLQPQRQPRTLEVRMVPSQFIQEEYELYCRYQVAQHGDDPAELSPGRYKAFLVDTPLLPVPAGPPGVPECGYGSFHQLYLLDGRLIAVGVVDVLPRCLSSKYFFWDPSFAWLALGRYGALREIQWTAAAAALMAAPISAPAPSTGTTAATAAGAIATAQPALRYYYLGYYIHGCPKMSYKAEFRPSELLCPAAQVWVELDAGVRAALDAAPYVELSQLAGAVVSPNLSLARRWKPPSLVPGEAANGVRNEEQRHAPVAVDGGGGGDAGGSVAGASGGSSGHPSSHPGDSSSGACDDCGSQLLFLLKQPVRWGVLRDSGMIAPPVVASMQARLAAWRRVVGETAAHMLYAAPSDLTTPPAG